MQVYSGEAKDGDSSVKRSQLNHATLRVKNQKMKVTEGREYRIPAELRSTEIIICFIFVFITM